MAPELEAKYLALDMYEPWEVTFTADGRFSRVAKKRGGAVEGSIIVAYPLLVTIDESGTWVCYQDKIGTYQWSIENGRLTLTVLNDQCPYRLPPPEGIVLVRKE